MEKKELINFDEYSINFLERIEDWYIAEIEHNGEFFDNLSEALDVFKGCCIKLITNNISTVDLDAAIKDQFSDQIDDDFDISHWSMGYLLSLQRDEDTLLSLFFDYDFKTKLISNCYIVEFNKNELSAFDLSNLFSRLELQSY
jgi:hypothetical protein